MRTEAILLLILGIGTPAIAAFETAPGPAPGGLAGWAWGSASPDHRWGARASAGLPAAVPDLIWTHLRAGRSWGVGSLAAEMYELRLEELYREHLAGVGCGAHGVELGVRRWWIDWSDGSHRAGWTITTAASVRHRGLKLRGVVQDIRLGPSDRAAPPCRFGVEAGGRWSPVLETAVAHSRESNRGRTTVRFRWIPAGPLRLSEEIQIPGAFISGFEVRLARLTAGVWFAPSSSIGSRTGFSCAWGG